jgi:hypothetical protein
MHPFFDHFSDTLSEIPFDLFFFHYILPQTIRFIKPDVIFRKLVSAWFSYIAKSLRLTHFLLGKENEDELSDCESECEEDRRGMESKIFMSSKKADKREKRYMRVPNHDNIEIIPKEKMLIPMKEEDEVFGRPGETEDEVKANWTKVYIPDYFYTRVGYHFLVIDPSLALGACFASFMHFYILNTFDISFT